MIFGSFNGAFHYISETTSEDAISIPNANASLIKLLKIK